MSRIAGWHRRELILFRRGWWTWTNSNANAQTGNSATSGKGRDTPASTSEWCRQKSKCSRTGRTMRPKPKRALWVGLKTGIKPHGFSTSTKQRRKLRPRSRAMERRARQYGKQRGPFLVLHPTCAVCKVRQSQTIHHVIPVSIRPDLFLCESNWIAVCLFPCHRMLHDNPKWAYENGYLERTTHGNDKIQ